MVAGGPVLHHLGRGELGLGGAVNGSQRLGQANKSVIQVPSTASRVPYFTAFALSDSDPRWRFSSALASISSIDLTVSLAAPA